MGLAGLAGIETPNLDRLGREGRPFLAWGSPVSCGSSSDALVSLVDIAPTVLELAGMTPRPGTQGKSLMPILRGETESVRNALFIEARAKADALPQRTMITRDHKLVLYGDTDQAELYDLRTDPDQYRNLWNISDGQTLKTDLLHLFSSEYLQLAEGQPAPRSTFA